MIVLRARDVPADLEEFFAPLDAAAHDVFILGPSPTREAHFATFPPALVEPLLLASTSARGACARCGAQWARVVGNRVVRPPEYRRGNTPEVVHAYHGESDTRTLGMVGGSPALGWRATCDCADAGEPVPCTVLDPFAGSGTVGLVAVKHRRRAILIDASATYLREIADVRTRGVQVELGVEAGSG